MKVKELIELLKEQDQESNVFMSSDCEGNSYSTMDAKFSVDYDFNRFNGTRFTILTPYEEGLDYDDLQ